MFLRYNHVFDHPPPRTHVGAYRYTFSLLFQDYAPIPAQKRLLAKKTGNEVWSNVRPPLISMSKEKGNELANELNNNFGYSF